MNDAPTTAFRFTAVDALLTALLTLVGAAVRLYALQLVPTLTDETDEIQFALRIAGGGFAPAVSVDAYNGPLHHYLMAAGLALGGGAPWPRTLVMLLGALTVGLTYLLGVSLAAQAGGRESAWPRLAGGIAAALMAVSFVPVVVNSHIAWSNATTPFWTTLTLVILSEARRQARPALLVAAGVAAGLAVQTHPTAIIVLVGAAAWVAVTRPAWLRTRWPWLALGAAILMVSNLIGYNVLTAGGSAEGAARRDYAFTGGVGLSEYLANAQGFVGLAYQMVGSTFVSTLGGDAGAAAMRSPAVILYAVVAVTAVLYTARRAGLPLACWLAALALLPIINRAYDSHISARYMAPLLPPTFAAMGALLAAGVAMLRGGSWARLAVGAAAATLAMLLVVYPAARLNNYYFFELADGRNNARLWQLVDAVRGPGQAGTPILLDRGLRDARLDAGGHVYKALGTLLDLERVPHQNPRVEELPTAPDGALLVLTDAQREALASILRLTPVDVGAPPLPAAPGGYWLYRVDSH